MDDHKVVARALARSIRSAVPRFGATEFDVAIALTLDDARRTLAGHADWVGFLFDVQLGKPPDQSGFALLDEAMLQHSHVPAIMVSGLEAPDVIREAGNRLVPYVLKPVPEIALRRFVESALASREHTDQRIVAACRELVIRAGLRPAEATVLRLALAHCSRDTMLASLGITENTLKTHVKWILRRTGAATMSQLIEDVLAPVLAGEPEA